MRKSKDAIRINGYPGGEVRLEKLLELTVDKPIYLTSEGKKKLEEELKYLMTVRRKEVAAAIQSARGEGDISENSAYDEAKSAQAFLEGRIQTIEAQLRKTVLVQKSGVDQVEVGSKVTVAEEDFAPEIYYIVGFGEADPFNGRISNESPIGQALLGAKVGDTVTANTPNGPTVFKVVKIE